MAVTPQCRPSCRTSFLLRESGRDVSGWHYAQYTALHNGDAYEIEVSDIEPDRLEADAWEMAQAWWLGFHR